MRRERNGIGYKACASRAGSIFVKSDWVQVPFYDCSNSAHSALGNSFYQNFDNGPHKTAIKQSRAGHYNGKLAFELGWG